MNPLTCAAPAAAALCAFALAGCVTASSRTTQPLSADLADSGFVQEVNVSATDEAGVTAAFAENMAAKLKAGFAECATGARPLRVDVMLQDTKASNPLRSALLTDTNEVAGQVTIYSLETGAVAGQYDVTFENRGGLGPTGALMQAAMGERQITSGFASEICRRAFNGDADETRESFDPIPF